MKEISNVAPEDTDREKFPSKSVTVPFVVPFSTTLAPITGSPIASLTVPLIETLFWRDDCVTGNDSDAANTDAGLAMKPADSNRE